MTPGTVEGAPRRTVVEAHLDETFYALLEQVDPGVARAIEENVVDQLIARTDRYERRCGR